MNRFQTSATLLVLGALAFGLPQLARAVAIDDQLAAGEHFTCTVTDIGSVKCWGSAPSLYPPVSSADGSFDLGFPDMRSVVASIASGVGSVCATTEAGTVRCRALVGTVPGHTGSSMLHEPMIDTAAKVAVGDGHACALLQSGTAKCWGSNASGELGSGDKIDRTVLDPVQVVGLSGATEISLGARHSCALIDDGTVRCWGDNGWGQLGDGTLEERSEPVIVGGVSNAVSVAAGASHTCALLTDRTVVCWGINDSGELGRGFVSNWSTSAAVVSDLTDAVGLAAGGIDFSGHTCALMTNGTVRCWGENFYGQLGNGTTADSAVPVQVNGLSDVADLTVGGWHSCARLNDGRIECWGWNDDGQLGDGSTNSASEPQAVADSPFDVHRLTYSEMGGGSITGETVQIVNDGEDGTPIEAVPDPGFAFVQWSDGGNQNPRVDAQVDSSVTVHAIFAAQPDTVRSKRVSAQGQDSCAIVPGGEFVQCWGDQAWSVTGAVGSAAKIAGFPDNLAAIAGAADTLCALTAAGELWCRGYRPGGGTSFSNTPVQPTGLETGVIDVARNYGHVCAVKSDGSVWCWGYASYGLGDGTSTQSNTPLQVLPPGFDAVGVVAGGQHMCAWGAHGEARCWGSNASGQIGSGSTGGTISTPTAVLGMPAVQGMAAAFSHTCAKVSGNQVYCWGSNDYSQLGNGNYSNAASPVLASNFSGASHVFAGNSFTCAQLNASGQLVCNGASYYRQTAASGVLYPDLGQVALGPEHGCALIDGQARCWGNNPNGQAGSGRFGHEYEPVALVEEGFAHAPLISYRRGCAAKLDGDAHCWGGSFVQPPYASATVDGLGGAADFVSAAPYHQCALRQDGEVLCWGSNWYGMLGDGSTTSSNTPVMVTGLEESVTQIAVAYYHNCVLLADETVACWGQNGDGRAGGADLENRLVPGPVSGLSDVKRIDSGFNSNCAVNAVGEVWCWGDNDYGQLGDGTTVDSATPVKVQGLPAAAVNVAVGSYFLAHACALLVDGRVACWGVDYGSAPVLLDASDDFVRIDLGDFHGCGLTTSGQVQCWGWGREGQLGIGEDIRLINETDTPMSVSLPDTTIDLSANQNQTCALLATGQARCWGENQNAQLGIGRRGVVEAPSEVVGFGYGIFESRFE